MTDATKSQLAKKKGARTKPTAQLLRLVPKTELEKKPCSETIESITWLLQEALAGRIRGLVYGAILPDKRYVLDNTGEASHNLVTALGVSQLLIRKIGDEISQTG